MKSKILLHENWYSFLFSVADIKERLVKIFENRKIRIKTHGKSEMEISLRRKDDYIKFLYLIEKFYF